MGGQVERRPQSDQLIDVDEPADVVLGSLGEDLAVHGTAISRVAEVVIPLGSTPTSPQRQQWFEGTFDHLRAGGRFAGYSCTIRGMEGLTGLQNKLYVVGVFGKGFEHVEPGVYCWNGFNGMYDNDGKPPR